MGYPTGGYRLGRVIRQGFNIGTCSISVSTPPQGRANVRDLERIDEARRGFKCFLPRAYQNIHVLCQRLGGKATGRGEERWEGNLGSMGTDITRSLAAHNPAGHNPAGAAGMSMVEFGGSLGQAVY